MVFPLEGYSLTNGSVSFSPFIQRMSVLKDSRRKVALEALKESKGVEQSGYLDSKKITVSSSVISSSLITKVDPLEGFSSDSKECSEITSANFKTINYDSVQSISIEMREIKEKIETRFSEGLSPRGVAEVEEIESFLNEIEMIHHHLNLLKTKTSELEGVELLQTKLQTLYSYMCREYKKYIAVIPFADIKKQGDRYWFNSIINSGITERLWKYGSLGIMESNTIQRLTSSLEPLSIEKRNLKLRNKEPLSHIHDAISHSNIELVFSEQTLSVEEKVSKLIGVLNSEYSKVAEEIAETIFKSSDQSEVITELKEKLAELNELSEGVIFISPESESLSSFTQKIEAANSVIEELEKDTVSTDQLINLLRTVIGLPSVEGDSPLRFLSESQTKDIYKESAFSDALLTPLVTSLEVGVMDTTLNVIQLLKQIDPNVSREYLMLECFLSDYSIDIEDSVYVYCKNQSSLSLDEKRVKLQKIYLSISEMQKQIVEFRELCLPEEKEKIDQYVSPNFKRLERLKGIVASFVLEVPNELVSSRFERIESVDIVTPPQEWFYEKLQECIEGGVDLYSQLDMINKLMESLPEYTLEEVLVTEIQTLMSDVLEITFIKALASRRKDDLHLFARTFKNFESYMEVPIEKQYLYHCLARKSTSLLALTIEYSPGKRQSSFYSMLELRGMYFKMLEMITFLKEYQSHPRLDEFFSYEERSILFEGIEQIYRDLLEIESEWNNVMPISNLEGRKGISSFLMIGNDKYIDVFKEEEDDWGALLPDIIGKIPQFYHHFAPWISKVLRIQASLSKKSELSLLGSSTSLIQPSFYFEEGGRRFSDTFIRMNQKFNLSGDLIRDILRGRKDDEKDRFKNVVKLYKRHKEMYTYINGTL
jgi:hypothetical protein